MSDALVTLLPDWPAPSHVKLISTTRVGGCSLPPYDGFNLAKHTNDADCCVEKNRMLLKDFFHLPAEPIWLNQIHSSHVVSVNDRHFDHSDIISADASWTNQANKVCAVLTADCLPVFITDVTGSIVAVAHAGWKGLLAGVIAKTIKALNCKLDTLLVWLGPAIGPQAFVVGSTVKDAFTQKFDRNAEAFVSDNNDYWQANLYQLAKIELEMLGVNRIYGGDYCTHTDSERFYSYRRDGEHTGRMGHFIWLDSAPSSMPLT